MWQKYPEYLSPAGLHLLQIRTVTSMSFKEHHSKDKPECFSEKCPLTRVIIDCTEIFILFFELKFARQHNYPPVLKYPLADPVGNS